MKDQSLYPLSIMKDDPYGLDRYELSFRWGNYGFRVLHFHLATFAPGSVIAMHKHSTYEFHFIADGKGTVEMDERQFKLHSGMFYLTGPDVLHRQISDRQYPMRELCLHLDIFPLDDATPKASWESTIEQEEAHMCVQELRRLPLLPTEDQFLAMSYFFTAYKAWKEDDPFFHATFKHAVMQICIRAVRAYRQEKQENEIPAREMNAYRYELATQFIRDNYALPLTLEEVASKVFISGRQLQRIFKEQGECTFREYVESIRLAHIKKQLTEEDTPLEQIAKRHGFNNTNYLFTVFKKKHGMTPGDYRALTRK